MIALYLLILIVGCILGVAFTSYAIRQGEWVKYKRDEFIFTNGIIIIMYESGDVFATRDRNEIRWSHVTRYRLI